MIRMSPTFQLGERKIRYGRTTLKCDMVYQTLCATYGYNTLKDEHHYAGV